MTIRIAVILFAINFIGCSTEMAEKTSFEEDIECFTGEWTVIEQYQKSLGDSVVIEIENNFNLTLFSDGNGIEEHVFNTFLPKDSFEWYYHLDPPQIVFLSEVSDFFNSYKKYDVVKKEMDRMEWKAEYDMKDFSGKTFSVKSERIITRK